MEPRPINSEIRKVRSEAGYEYIREIASGGYGYVYLFSRTRQPEDGEA